mmetsp:Transcript_17451/g.53110  ORF Transcript_17451/g.53110 Transcript_17451/m.53110 type:complete len:271 (+) Transcript_17451:73-885(+)
MGQLPEDDMASPRVTHAQSAARKRREARETARLTRLGKQTAATPTVVAAPKEGKRTRGIWADNDYGGFPPPFGMDFADVLYVDDDPFPTSRTDEAMPECGVDVGHVGRTAEEAAAPAEAASGCRFFDDDGTDAWWRDKRLLDVERMQKVLRPPHMWRQHAARWNTAAGCYAYAGPELFTTNHDTVPQLIEAGDVELLEKLLECGHLPRGLAEADPESGLSPAYIAVACDQPAAHTRASFGLRCRMQLLSIGACAPRKARRRSGRTMRWRG